MHPNVDDPVKALADQEGVPGGGRQGTQLLQSRGGGTVEDRQAIPVPEDKAFSGQKFRRYGAFSIGNSVCNAGRKGECCLRFDL